MSLEPVSENARLRLLESCVQGLVFEFDASGRYLEVWTRDETLLARPRDELVGHTLEEVFGAEAGAPFIKLVASVLGRRAPDRLEYPLTVVGGARWFAAEAFLGQTPGTVVMRVQDITERKALEAQLLEADRLATIGLLAGGVGHEVNTPLAWVMNQLTALRTEVQALGPTAAPQAARVTEALEGCERIRQIVRDLAFFTRAPETETRPVDLRTALDWATAIASAELRHRAQLVRDEGPTPLVLASEARLGQVFLNLLINAAQAIDEGAADRNAVRVTLSTDALGRACVEVADTGSGMTAQQQAHLFEPFFTTKPRGQGTGLGLTVSRRIVESLGGTLELIRSGPQGTCFRVTLPPTLASTQPVQAARGVLGAAGARLKVLLVDDNLRFLQSLEAVLSPTYQVELESSARVALARLQRGEQFDAVVCDLMMPDFTGMELYEALAQSLPEALTRLVLMTGGAYTPRAREFLQAVQCPRVEKPFRAEQLEALIAALAGGAGARPVAG